MPVARSSARRAACSAGQRGVERADGSARSAVKLSSAPSGSASRSSPSRLRGDLARSAGRRRSARTGRRSATGTTIVRAWPPSIAVDVERRLGRRADVELRRGGARRTGGRRRRRARPRRSGSVAQDSISASAGGDDARRAAAPGSLPSGPGRTARERAVQRVERVQRGAAVHARVRGLRAGADLDVGEHHAARRERQRGRVGVDHAAVEDDHARRRRARPGAPTRRRRRSRSPRRPRSARGRGRAARPRVASSQATCSSGRKLPLSSVAPRA